MQEKKVFSHEFVAVKEDNFGMLVATNNILSMSRRQQPSVLRESPQQTNSKRSSLVNADLELGVNRNHDVSGV